MTRGEEADDKPVYERVSIKCASWNAKLPKPAIGLVVGATDLRALEKIRQVNSSAWILCPGVGAQGGKVIYMYHDASHCISLVYNRS